MVLFQRRAAPQPCTISPAATPPASRHIPPRQTAGVVSDQSGDVIETDIPARLDALPFGRFHLLVIMALGITWILDGLEVTLPPLPSGKPKQTNALGLGNAQCV